MSTAFDGVAAQGNAVPGWDRFDAYLFDIDGTLLNMRDGVHYNAFHSGVQQVFGVSSKIDGLPVHGNTDIGILRALLRREAVPDAQVEARLSQVLERMCDEVEHNCEAMRPELCPVVSEVLQKLKRDGRLMGVVSGNIERIGWMKLRAAGVAEYFSFGCFCDQSESRAGIFRAGIEEVKQRLGPQASMCVVGDTPSDVQAAREVGVPVIAVATGIFSLDDLSRERPDVCVACCTELMQS